MAVTSNNLTTFSLDPGRIIGGKYVVESLLGGGWEGEVYRVVERRTGATRAAKLFFPKRNKDDKAVAFYARKLEQLRDCPVVIKYHHSESMRYKGIPVTALVSEFVEGEILDQMIETRRGKRLPEYEALSILYQLVVGLEQIHAKRDYHGDLHSGNILVQRRGVHFDLKLVDLFDLGKPSAAKAREDIIDAIRIFYDMLGGQRRYKDQRPEIKWIICGLKRTMISKRFPTARQLREHLDSFEWAGNTNG